MAVVEVRGTTYHIDDKLKEKWDEIKDGKLKKYDEDRVYVTDGREGTGKSLFTIQQAAYIDPTILDDENGKVLPRICFSTEEVLEAIRNTRSTENQTKVIVFDEAFRGMSSKAALSKENKKLVEAMMEMRQFNLVLFIVSPSFFLLELYPAMLRSNALFHITKEKKSRRRHFKVYNYKQKAMLYQTGVRKGWGYSLITKIRGKFFNTYPSGDEFERKYRDKKAKSHIGNIEKENEVHVWKDQRDKLLTFIYENYINSLRKLSERLKEAGVWVSPTQLSEITRKTRKNP